MQINTRQPIFLKPYLFYWLISLFISAWISIHTTGCTYQSDNTACGVPFNRRKYRPHQLKITKHAQCRMDCRQISTATVHQVFEKGTIICQKSDPAQRKFLFEGFDRHGHRIHIVIADNQSHYSLVTVINKDQPHDPPACNNCN